MDCSRVSAIRTIKYSRRYSSKTSRNFDFKRSNLNNCVVILPERNANIQRAQRSEATPKRIITGGYANNHIVQCNEAISVRITERRQASNRQKNSHVNHANVIHISTITQNINTNARRRTMLPSFYLLNARSPLPKVDELTALLSTNPADLVAITESWLNDDIDSGLLSVRGFNLFRNDRVLGRWRNLRLHKRRRSL